MPAPMSAQDFLRVRELNEQAIEAGRRAETEELLVGHDFARGSLETDFRIWSEEVREDVTALHGLEAASIIIRNIDLVIERGPRAPSIKRLRQSFEAVQGRENAIRCLVYGACLEDTDARMRLAAIISHRQVQQGQSLPHGAISRQYWSSIVLSLMTRSHPSMALYYHHGYSILCGAIEATQKIAEAVGERIKSEDAAADDHIWDPVLTALAEDRAEVRREPVSSKIRKLKQPSVVVVPASPVSPTSHRREIRSAFDAVAGKRLPIRGRPDTTLVRWMMDDRYPWAADLTNTILTDLAAGVEMRFRPTLLYSGPGLGKSSYIKMLLGLCSMPHLTVALGGVADGALAGTSAQWSTARPSNALQLIARTKVPNPALILDEIDKVGSGNVNGSAADALLPFLERSTSKAIMDPALEVECDLSWVSWFATANDITKVPPALRDRFRVIEMPSPGMQHISVVIRGIIEDIAEERQQRPEFLGELAQDEVEIARKFWRSGSIRQLRRIVETMIDSRPAMHMGRA